MPTDQRVASLPVTAPPADGTTINGIYSFAVDANGLPNVATVEFAIGSLRLGVAQTAPYQVSWNTGYGKDGNYSIQVTARDAAGRTIATGERLFNIANRKVTMQVSSPDISRQLNGTVTFQVYAYDPVNYPVIFNLFIDGEFSDYWAIGSTSLAHSATAVFNIDTTAFSNGPHELTVNLTDWNEPAPPHIYAAYSAMLDRIVTINNGHALMEIAANYQHVYLNPGQTLSLSCRQLFTDNSSGPCRAPVYVSGNPAIASVSGGLIQANSAGFTTVAVTDAGKTAKAYVWVKASLNIPHFSGGGQILNSYQNGNSIFPVAPFVLDPVYMPSETIAETRRAGFNTVTFGFYQNPRSTTISYTDWKSLQDRMITSRISWAKANGFRIIGTGDDGFRRPGDDAWWTLNWAYGRQATQYAMQTMADSGVAVAVNVVDEAPMFWGWYPINPTKVGQPGLPGQPASFQSVSCSGTICTVNWPMHGYSSGRWIAFQGSRYPELNTAAGKPFVVQGTTQDSFDFLPSAPITGTFTSDNDPGLETMLFAAWPCNAGSVDGNNHPCVPFTANDAVNTYSNWLRNAVSRVPFSWPSLGSLPPTAQANWFGQSAVGQGISDFATHYWIVFGGSRTHSWSDGVQQRTFWMKDAFYARQPYMAQDRPQLMLVCGSSFAYVKQKPGGAYYNPLADKLEQPGCDGSAAVAEIMTAAAIGNAGVRQYQFDKDTTGDRAAYPVGSFLETGMRPDSEERNSKEIWQASGYASNLITKALQPYILGLAVSSPGYVRGITTAVRRGSNATMLMVVNGNDAERSLNIDFTPYRTGAAITRYRLSYFSLRSDVLPDSGSDNLTLPKGGSAVYLFPFSSGTTFLQSTSFQPELPVGATQASLSYNYIYSEHLTQTTDSVDCTRGCALQLDTRLGDVYYQFTYTDTGGKVIGRSSVLKAKAAAAVNITASSLNQVYDGLSRTVAVTTDPPGLSTSVTYSRNGSIISTPVDAGNYDFVAAVTDANYQGFAAGTLNVVPAVLTVTANSISRFYGSANPPLTGSVAGVVNSDNLSATFTTSATTDTKPGKYPITPVINDPNHRLSNYHLNVVNGTLTVIPAPIMTLSGTGFAFGAQDLFSTSKAFTLTVGNKGTADLMVTAVSLEGANAGDFTLANHCDKAVAAGATCSITLAFTPLALRSRIAVLTLTDNTSGSSGSQQIVALSGNGVLSYAVYATGTECGAVNFSGNAFTDSFESSLGSYAATKSNTHGDIAVNGNATLRRDAIVNGTIFAPNPVVGGCKNGSPGISISGEGRATGRFAKLTPLAFTTPPAVTVGASDVKVDSSARLSPGKYRHVTVGDDATLTLSPGTYIINSLKLMDGAKITILPAGQVIFNVVGLHVSKPVDLRGGSVSNPSGNPADLLIIYGGSGEMELTGRTDSYGIVYAPNAAAKLTGERDWFGALVVKTLDDSGESAIHYDRTLGLNK